MKLFFVTNILDYVVLYTGWTQMGATIPQRDATGSSCQFLSQVTSFQGIWLIIKLKGFWINFFKAVRNKKGSKKKKKREDFNGNCWLKCVDNPPLNLWSFNKNPDRLFLTKTKQFWFLNYRTTCPAWSVQTNDHQACCRQVCMSDGTPFRNQCLCHCSTVELNTTEMDR